MSHPPADPSDPAADGREADPATGAERIVYCNCTYAKVLDPERKAEVLRALCDSGRSFEAVADLCEMSARRDPSLSRLCAGGPVKIAACFPRAVQWLFHAAGSPLPEDGRVKVLNMREDSAETVIQDLLAAKSEVAS